MKIRKILAGLSAAAVFASAMAVTSFADDAEIAVEVEVPFELAPWASQWVQSYDAALADLDLSEYVMRIDLETSTEPEGWEELVIVSGEKYMAEAGVSEYVIDYNLGEIELNEWGGFGFNIQAGHIGLVINDVAIVPVAEDEEPTEDEESIAVNFAANPYTMDRDENWAGWTWKNGEEINFNADGTLEFVFNFEDVINIDGAYPDGSFANMAGVQFFFGENVLEANQSITATLKYTIVDEAGNVLAEAEVAFTGATIQVSLAEDGTPWEDLIALGNITVTASVTDIVVTTAEDPTTEDPTTEDPTTEDPTTEDPTEEEPSDVPPNTGVVVAFGGLTLAAVAAVATKKRR